MEALNIADLVKLDDSALIAWRHRAHTRLKNDPDAALQVAYDATTQEVAARAGGKRPGGGDAA